MVNNQDYKIKDYDLELCRIGLADVTFSAPIDVSLYSASVLSNKSDIIIATSAGVYFKQDVLVLTSLSGITSIPSGVSGLYNNGNNYYSNYFNGVNAIHDLQMLVVPKEVTIYPIMKVGGAGYFGQGRFDVCVLRRL